jgi:hypothetical protein
LASTNYSFSFVDTGRLTVNQATPILTWPAPAPIPYGVGLGNSQLNASANTPGIFTYTPAAGTVLPSGTQTLSVSFAPTDTANFTSPATLSVSIYVQPLTHGGFYQPVTMSGSTVVFNAGKGGSTVPMKFNVYAPDGTEITNTSIVTSTTYTSVSCSGGTTDPLDPNALATGGTSLRYDTTAHQFIFNWQTPGKGCYKFTANLADGTRITNAYFQLK